MNLGKEITARLIATLPGGPQAAICGSRLTDADACHLAALVARRNGVLAHLTAPASVIRARLLERDGPAAANLADIESLITAYESVVTTLAPYLPVVRLDTE
ncbi:MAG: hypothetical protein ACRDRO_23605 [Pseudonocardiaceae bacterium]